MRSCLYDSSMIVNKGNDSFTSFFLFHHHYARLDSAYSIHTACYSKMGLRDKASKLFHDTTDQIERFSESRKIPVRMSTLIQMRNTQTSSTFSIDRHLHSHHVCPRLDLRSDRTGNALFNLPSLLKLRSNISTERVAGK